MTPVTLNPAANPRLKSLIGQWGAHWWLVESRPFVHCLGGPGLLITPVSDRDPQAWGHHAIRWVRPSEVFTPVDSAPQTC